MSYSVVIPNRYPDIIQPLLESINHLIPKGKKPRIIIVADGHDRDYGFTRVRYQEPEFHFGKAANLGIEAAEQDDIILMNDDTVLLERDFFSRLDWLAWDIVGLGVLSPLIVGCVGTNQQRWHERNQWWKPGETTKFLSGGTAVCFPCVWLSRKMLNSIGLFDESIPGYGGEDVDLCRRALAGHWNTAVTSQLKVQHGDGGKELAEGRGKTWSLSFARRHP